MTRYSNQIRLPDSPKAFLKLIPTELKANIQFRKRLHTQLSEEPSMQETFRLMCREKQQIAFKTMFWTFQPKREQSIHKHLPFVTWECQDEAIERMIDCIRNGGDLLIDKSREMGATWIILGAFFAEWLIVPDSTFLVVSRKQEYVWKRGNPDTLYWKLQYLLRNLPVWITPRVAIMERHMGNLDNGSVIDGESTNEDVGAGGRRQAIMCDEFARVDAPAAAMIAETISDTTPCRIFNSTPVSRGHPFGKLRFGGKIEIITLPWWRHPYKEKGLYESKKPDYVTIHDLEYYKTMYPGVFDGIKQGVPFCYSAFEKKLLAHYADDSDIFDLRFIADGNDPANEMYYSPTGRRSPWYDRECERRTKRDKAVNIDIDYIGSGDVVFNPVALNQMIADYGREPDLRGEVEYNVIENRVFNPRFIQNAGRRRLYWWDALRGARPDQSHNYIVGCDISMGSGQSNSVASVFNCNTNTKIGRWLCPNTSPTKFAEQVVALCRWVGGANGNPFLIWENNGPGGIFGRRVVQLGYEFFYRERKEKSISRRRTDQMGWHSGRESKLNMLLGYDDALCATFQPQMEKRIYINPDITALREAEDYIFYEEGGGIGPSESMEDVGSAKEAHGDIVIADALCQLARHDQPRAAMDFGRHGEVGCMAYRRRVYQEQTERDSDLWLIN